jgi:hypothetical protein
MHPKRPLAEERVDDRDDSISHGRHVRVGRVDGRKRLLHLLTETGIRPRLIFGDARLVGGSTGMVEMVDAPCEGYL